MNASSLERSIRETNERARRRLLAVKGEPLLVADWVRALFVHYEVPPELLQPQVPFELDLREGRAYVSLVAFTMRRMRPRRGGRLGRWMFQAISTNDFLNVRTYVRHRGEEGIYFLTEWLNNRLSVLLGPGTFGLPYQFAHTRYTEDSETLSKTVSHPQGAKLVLAARLSRSINFSQCADGSLDDFLMERYTAFTSGGGRRRFFRIWHSPWEQAPVTVTVDDDNLLRKAFPWFANARLAHANYSPGADDVWMGRPQRVSNENLRPGNHALSGFFEWP